MLVYPKYSIEKNLFYKLLGLLNLFKLEKKVCVSNGISTIAPEENFPRDRVKVWIRVRIRVEGQLSSGNLS